MQTSAGEPAINEEGILSMDNIEQRVRKIVAEQLGVNEGDIKSESSFVDDLGAVSLDCESQEVIKRYTEGRCSHVASPCSDNRTWCCFTSW